MVILSFSVVTFTLNSLPEGQFGHKYVLETKCFTDGLEKQAEKNFICNICIMLFILRKIRNVLNISN